MGVLNNRFSAGYVALDFVLFETALRDYDQVYNMQESLKHTLETRRRLQSRSIFPEEEEKKIKLSRIFAKTESLFNLSSFWPNEIFWCKKLFFCCGDLVLIFSKGIKQSG